MTEQPRIVPPTGAKPQPQVGALCWRLHHGAAQVLLVTSRDTGRWVIPKGGAMKGRSAWDAAAREAWEEAGATGEIRAESLGRYDYLKRRARRTAACAVEVFPLQVRRLAALFPERFQRRRKWFAPEAAAREVAEADLAALILAFAATVPQTAPAGAMTGP